MGFNDILGARENFGENGIEAYENGWIGAIKGVRWEGWKGKRLGRRDGFVGIGRIDTLGIIGNIGRKGGIGFRAIGSKGNFGIRGKIVPGQGKKGFLRSESERIGSDSFKGGGFVGSFGQGKEDTRGLVWTLMTMGDLCEYFFITTGPQLRFVSPAKRPKLTPRVEWIWKGKTISIPVW